MEFITDKYLPGKVEPAALSWCPTMDVVVFASVDGSEVSLYRVSGQKVWSSNTRKRARPIKSTWKSDGKVLALVYEDCSYQIFSSSNGRIIHSSEPRTAYCVEWMKGDFESELEDSDQPLVNIDILKHVPKLPTLLTGKQNLSKLTATDLEKLPVELLIEGAFDGSFKVDIYGLFPIGGSQLKGSFAQKEGHITTVVANPKLLDHYCLFESTSEGPGEGPGLFLVPVRTPLIQKFGLHYLPEVTLVPAMITDTVEYIKSGLLTITRECKSLEEMTDRIVRQYTPVPASPHGVDNDNKSVKSQSVELSTALFECLLTCNYNQGIHEWVDSINEGGFKKYSTKLLGCYETSRKVLFEEVHPACERTLMLLSRLRGLSRWWDRGSVMGLDTEKLSSCIAQVEALSRSCNDLMWGVSTEFELFKSYLSWLGYVFNTCLDRIVVKPTEKFFKPEIETREVAKYLTQHFNNSIINSNAANDMLSNARQADQACLAAFDKIKDSLRAIIRANEPIKLSNSHYRSKMRYVGGGGHIYVLIQESATSNSLTVIHHSLADLELGDQASMIRKVQIYIGEPIIAAEFVNDLYILVLLKTKLLWINYIQLPYSGSEANVSSQVPSQEVVHHEVELGNFEPTAMVINGEKDHEMGCVLASDNQRYAFFYLEDPSTDV